MPVTIKSSLVKYKNASTGEYESINAISQGTTDEMVANITSTAQIKLTQINNAGTNQVTAVENAGATQVAAVNAKGEQALNSIPSDYTSLAAQVDSHDESIHDLELNKANSESVYSYKSRSGSIVTVDDAVAEPVKQMQIEIAPVQDLHGQAYPYPGGAGKNLYDASTVTEGKAIDSSGQIVDLDAGKYSQFIQVSASGTYTINFVAGVGGTWSRRVHGYNSSGVWQQQIAEITNISSGSVGSSTFTIPSGITQIRVSSNILDANIQVESGSTATSYAPYSNICPISGWTGANVTRMGKNLFNIDATYTQMTFTYKYEYTLKPNTKYTLSSNCPQVGVSASLYMNGGTTVSNGVKDGTPRTATTDSSGYLYISVRKTATGEGGFDLYTAVKNGTYWIQLEEGETVTTYQPYGQTYPITFPSEAGTVYGGTLTVNKDGSGTLTVDKGIVTYNGSEDWIANTGSGNKGFYRSAPVTGFDYIPVGNYLKGLESGSSSNLHYWEMRINAGLANLMIYPDPAVCADVTAWQTYLSNNNLQILYPLANPVTYSLTVPEVITLLQGYNTVYADCGNIDLLYAVRDFLTAEQVDKERIYETISTPAGVQTISDGADNLPIAMTIGIEPIQDLHGYEYPWSAGCGKNKFTTEGETTGYYLNTNGNPISVSGWNYSAFIPVLPSTQYTFNPNTTEGGSAKHIYFDSSKGFINYIASGPQTFTTPANCYFMRFSYRDTSTDIQLEFGSSATSFLPYSNICPISGWDEANVTRTGKNLLNPQKLVLRNGYTTPNFTTISGNIMTISGYSSGGRFACFNVKTEIGEVYTVHYSSATNATSIALIESDTEPTIWVNWGTNFSGSYTYTATKPWVQIYVEMSADNATITDFQIEKSTTYTGFEPYIAKTLSVNLKDVTGSTVYGGTLTINKDGSGTLVVDRVKYMYNGSSGFTYYSVSNVFTITTPSEIKTDNSPIASNMKGVIPTNSLSFRIGEIGLSANRASLVIKLPSDIDTDAKATTYLNNNPIDSVWYLATPTTYSLTPGQVKTLLGVNNIWADAGSVTELQYPADTKLYIDKKFAELSAAITALGT